MISLPPPESSGLAQAPPAAAPSAAPTAVDSPLDPNSFQAMKNDFKIHLISGFGFGVSNYGIILLGGAYRWAAMAIRQWWKSTGKQKEIQ